MSESSWGYDLNWRQNIEIARVQVNTSNDAETQAIAEMLYEWWNCHSKTYKSHDFAWKSITANTIFVARKFNVAHIPL